MQSSEESAVHLTALPFVRYCPNYVKQASTFKKSEDGVKAPSRVEAVIQKVKKKALEYGADPDMIENLYREMISSFINMEMNEYRKKQD